jgi:tetratricopeptide (TPR) repeat protein
MSGAPNVNSPLAPGRYPKFSMKEGMPVFLTEQRRYAEALALLSGLKPGASDPRGLDPRLVVTKAFCLFQEQHYVQALELLLSAERQGWATGDCFLLKAKTLYRLAEFETAKRAFEAADAYQPAAQTRRWIRRCAAKIDPLSRQVMYEAVPQAEAPSIAIPDAPQQQPAVERAPATGRSARRAGDLWIDVPDDGTAEWTTANAPDVVGEWREGEAAAGGDDRE